MAYFHRDAFHFEAVAAHSQTHHAGLAVQGFVLVEDEVAHAVIDLVAAVVLDGLEGVGVMAHEHIGTRQHEHVGIVTLTENGLQLMLLPPMERDDDDGRRVLLTEMVHSREQRVHRFLTHTGLVRQIGVVLKGEAQ